MDRHLIIKTRDELLRLRINNILYLEADRNYTRLLLTEGIQFTFAINLGRIEEMLNKQTAGSNSPLVRVGKSYIVHINLPKQKMLMLVPGGKPRELVISRDPLKMMKDRLEQEALAGTATPTPSTAAEKP